uniref:Uncharacterized protein LOC111132418 n=1 Tax=Crassostrea virginica TaxID=6565 RepID=A0A8B8E8C7_CRAVI|nr:uncharacterized protein LOC111132418 [Crassostrea virginica]
MYRPIQIERATMFRRRPREEDYESVLFPKDEEKDSDDSSVEDTEEMTLSKRRLPGDDSDEEDDAGFGEEEDEDDDEFPESVSFSSGREAALHQMKTALQQIGQNKQKLKEKRRQMDEQFKLQKQKKLEALAKKRLSEDFFDDLQDSVPKSNSLKRKAAVVEERKQDKSSEDEESFADTEEDFEVGDDFIPLEDRLGGVAVEKIKETKKKIMSAVEKARLFKEQRMYGGKIPRMTNENLIALKGKRKARHKITQIDMDVKSQDDPEIQTLKHELDWLLKDQVHKVLEEISNLLWECSRRFPTRPGHDESKSMVNPQRLLLSSANGSNGSVKCVVTLKGDQISDGDVNFRHKQGKENHTYRTSINTEVPWKLQQVQDATNFLYSAIDLIEEQEGRKVFHSSRQVTMILDRVINSLNQGRSALAFPKRKSLEELVYNRNMQTLRPSVPNDVALSFYIHASKLVLSVYHLGINPSTHQLDIISRNQVECSVQWLNEALMLFTLALQRCQQLKDKVCLLQQIGENTDSPQNCRRRRMDIYTQCVITTWIYFTVCLLSTFTVTSSQEVLKYDTAVQRCQLDESLMRSNPDLLEPGQGYWIGRKSVELGCSAKSGVCTRLIIGQTLKSRTQSLDLICAASSNRRVLTRMAVQCADGYDVATIASYDDINYLYNRSIFPTNRSMIINNFDTSGFRIRCGAVHREGQKVEVSYRDCGDLLPAVCSATDKNDLLKTLTIIEYSASRFKSVPSTNHVTVSEVYSSTNSDYAEGTKEQQNGTSLFGLGMGSVHLVSIGVGVVLTFIVLIIIIIVLVKRNHRHKDNRDPPSVKDNENEYASWFSSKEQLTDGSHDNREEGSHYMTIPADMEYLSLQQIPANEGHVYTSVAPPGRTRVFGKVKRTASIQR